jgi:hypothetical protein
MKFGIELPPSAIRVVLVAMALLTALTTFPVRASTPVSSPTPTALEPVVDAYRDEFAVELDTFPRYELDLMLDVAISTLSGTLDLTFPNQTGETLTELPLRLYPNAAYYLEGETSISAIEIDGQNIPPRFDESGTVLFLDLPAALSPGEILKAAIDFTTVIPRNSIGSYGILNHDLASDRFVLADWYPVIAGRDETGWRLEPPTPQGDPTFAATGIFDVRLRVPAGYTVIATGDETVLDDGTVQIESGPVREFAMVIARGLTPISTLVGDTEVTVFATPNRIANGERILEIAAAALDFYDAFGPYPFRELDFVEVPLSLAYGVSWSGILFINQGQFALPPEALASLDFTILHEIGHQWWGGTVGANSNDHTWMVEGLTNTTAVLAQAAIDGPAAASLDAWVVAPYLNLLDSSGDGVADVSIFDQPASAPLSTLAYGKGALGFLAIRNAIGADAFQQALASYAASFRLGIADPDDLLAAFESASGQDLEALWGFWFESALTTRADVEALVPEIVASLATPA